jgi:hypothetical protein
MALKKRRRKFEEIAASAAAWRLEPGIDIPASTEGIEPEFVIIGQDRAIKALRLGLELYKPGYNVFVCGITGSGRTSTVRRMLDRLSPTCTLAEDFLYVHNFDEPERPRLIRLPRGHGPKFRDAVHEMMKLLRREIESLINSDAVRRRVKELETDFLERAGDSAIRRANSRSASPRRSSDWRGPRPTRPRFPRSCSSTKSSRWTSTAST